MANTPISGFASGAPAQAGDEFVIARSGANFKLTNTNISSFVLGGPTTQLGAADVASGAVAQTLQVQSNTGAAQTGPNFTIKGSSGTTAGGSIIFQTHNGTAYATALTIASDRSATFASTISSTSIFANGNLGVINDTGYLYLGTSVDLRLYRDDSNTLALRGGTTNQGTFRIYNLNGTTTDYSRLSISCGTLASSIPYSIITSEAGGTGLATGLQFGAAFPNNGGTVAQTNVFYISTTVSNGVGGSSVGGHLVWNTDNAYDIGVNGVGKPRTINAFNIYGETGLSTASGGVIYFGARSKLKSNADGNISLLNGAEADFGRLQFGGTSSSFPALKRSTTTLQVRLADDTGDAALQCGTQTAGGTAFNVNGTGGNSIASVTNTTTGTLLQVLNSTSNPLMTVTDTTAGTLFSVQSTTAATLFSVNDTTSGTLLAVTNSSAVDVFAVSDAGQVVINGNANLFGEAANTLALRNAASRQQFYVYGSYSSAADYNRLEFYGGDGSGNCSIQAANAGTGTTASLYINVANNAGTIRFLTNSTSRWDITASGHFLAAIDNTYDIGASATASRPRNIYVGTSLTLGDAANIVAQTTTGTKIGTATSQKIGFWNAAPIAQPTTGVAEAAFVENSGGTAVNVDSTFGGYTLQQVVQALQNTGLLA